MHLPLVWVLVTASVGVTVRLGGIMFGGDISMWADDMNRYNTIFTVRPSRELNGTYCASN